MTAIVDYGVGNLFSLSCSLAAIGAESIVTRRPEELRRAGRIILPGVGAFGDAAERLQKTGLVPLLRELAAGGKPLLGICLGMQLLFERGLEFGEHAGLGLIPGEVVSLEADLAAAGLDLKVPHIGWNSLDIAAPDCPLLKYTRQGEFVYYVHSFHARCENRYLAATSGYGLSVAGVVQNGGVFGVQFHPEKSGRAGLDILRAFTEMS